MLSGQPRTGDAQFAAFVESTIGVENIFRGACISYHTCSPSFERIPVFVAVHTFGEFLPEILYILELTRSLSDGVPTMIPRALGYEHQWVIQLGGHKVHLTELDFPSATEYWQSKDPGLFTSPPTTVTKCVGPEDKACSDSICTISSHLS
jgi:hypothetical protein